MKGDRARVSVRVSATRELAFTTFTEELDGWWRQGRRYRMGTESVMRLERGVGGRLIEEVTTEGQHRTYEMGRVLTWEPPKRLVLAWRAVNFEADDPSTEVEVTFERAIGHSGEGTLVTIEHRGWTRVRPDHPVRHGREAAAFLANLGQWWSDLGASFRDEVTVPTPEQE